MGRADRRSTGGLRRIMIPILVIVIAALVFFGGFRIRRVTVIGNTTHSAETIKNDLIYDFWTESTLIFAGIYRTAGYESRTPYLSSVQAKMTSPIAVTITVTEKRVIGYVQYNSMIVSFDSEGMILDISDQVYDGAILVDGITMDEPVLYQKLSLNNSSLLRTMLSITKLTRDADLTPDAISFGDNQNITIRFGSVYVELGQDEYLEEKIANLEAVYPQISHQSGTLNMSAFTGNNETITFVEGLETEAVTEAAEDTGDYAEGEEGSDGGDAEAVEDDGTGEAAGGEDVQIEVTDNGEAADNGGDTSEEGGDTVDTSQDTTTGVMVFDSSGTLRYDAHISGGVVVDAYGNPIDGCSVTEEGYIKDAYWNIINPADGSLMNG